MLDAIKKRYSPMIFTAEAVSKESLNQMLDAARWAASSYNEQPWRFIVAHGNDHPNYAKLHDVLNEYNQNWAITAPVLMLVLAKKHFTLLPETLNVHSWYDSGMAVANMAVEAASMGIQLHQMGGYDAVKAREIFSIPDEYDVIAAIAAGHPGKPADLPEPYRSRAMETRTRKEISEILL
jgi:nitroreductase